MRQKMLHQMNLEDASFQKVKSGSKDIELRLYDEKRRLVKIGDRIIFVNTKTQEMLGVEVFQLHVFSSFRTLYSMFDKVRLGYLPDEEANPMDMETYYSQQQMEKYGVVGIEVILSNKS